MYKVIVLMSAFMLSNLTVSAEGLLGERYVIAGSSLTRATDPFIRSLENPYKSYFFSANVPVGENLPRIEESISSIVSNCST